MSQEILVVINLRGGWDGLNVVVPYNEANYYRLRPTIALDRPDNKTANKDNSIIALDNNFGFHPALAPLMPLYKNGQLAVIHSVGWPGDSHSHFEAWEQIESGSLNEPLPTTGWLARFLRECNSSNNSPMRAVAFGEMMPKMLSGINGVTVLNNINDYRLQSHQEHAATSALKRLYKMNNNNFNLMSSDLKMANSDLKMIGTQTLNAIDHIKSLSSNNSKDNYPKSEFGDQLSSVEKLIRANIGLEAACIDLIGWDTHILQGAGNGAMARFLSNLAQGIKAFTDNMQDMMQQITIITISEFGRRVSENSSNGTDHGQGGVMFFCGGKVKGGNIYGDWPGLADDKLVGPGDLAITTDFRDALNEIFYNRLGSRAINKIFADYQSKKRLAIFN